MAMATATAMLTRTTTTRPKHTNTGIIAGMNTATGAMTDGRVPDTVTGVMSKPAGTMTVTTTGETVQRMPKATGIDNAALPAAGCMVIDGVFLSQMDAELTGDGRLSGPLSLDNFLGETQRKAYQVAYGALWDRETALDVVQESMLRFVEYYRQKPASDWPALFRSVLNSRINDQRRKRLLANTGRKLLSLTGLKLADADADEQLHEAELPASVHDRPAATPERDVAAGQLKRLIEQAVGTLPERQRQVFLLREQLGLSIQETADTLGCSVNSIKQHHFRALRALRGQLAEVWQHEQL